MNTQPMTPTEIDKSDNELIAEFMGKWQVRTDGIVVKDDGKYIGYTDDVTSGCWLIEDLSYNSSWNWLMPVVEKIQMFAHVKIENTQCLITVNGTLITGRVNGLNIKNVYYAVVDYIKWYNNSQNNGKL